MKDLILQLFGDYTPVMYTSGSAIDGPQVVASGMAGVDWPWLAGVALFALTLYVVFYTVGVILKNGK